MRTSGILMHVSSLWTKYGIGTFGKEACAFVDFLKKGGQSYWQILPLGPTTIGDSPYQSFSSFAGNPYFIDLEALAEKGLLSVSELEQADLGADRETVDYEKLYNNRFPLLKKAVDNFDKTDSAYKKFCKENAFWLQNYALFMALKDENGGSCFTEWPKEILSRSSKVLSAAKKRLSDKIEFQKVMQYFFFSQWSELKQYANEQGIKIIGDIPIYVAFDSADVFANRELFEVGEDYTPSSVAGVPPDAFSEDGQLWGNPLYDWNKMKEDGYSWWKQRIAHSLKLYDVIRIDHFRAFSSYFAIPFGDETAKNGKWKKGPGIKFFKEMKAHFGELPIIAEDLGNLTDDVRKLLKATGFPGMKILQFAFDSREDSDYLPHNYDKKCVVYTGTHDNDTIMGWFEQVSPDDAAYCKKYLRLNESEGYNWGMIKGAMSTTADTCILTMQDLLGLGSEARMNTPATLGGNWTWRVRGECINDWLASLLYDCTDTYRRLPQK